MKNVKLLLQSDVNARKLPMALSSGLSWLRIVLYFAFYIGVQVIQIYHGDFLNVRIWQPINLIIGIAAFVQILFIDVLANYLSQSIQQKLLIIVDAIVLASVIYIFGSFNSMYLFMLLVLVGSAGILYGFESSFKTTLFGLALFNLAFVMNPQMEISGMYGAWAINFVSAIIVSYISSVLGEQLSSAKVQIESKNLEIQSLENINELIVENIATGLILLSVDKKVIKANQGASKLFNDMSLEGRHLGEFFAELNSEVDDYSSQVGALEPRRIELQIYSSKNERLIIESIISRIQSSKANGPQFLCLLQNLTEIKSLEFALQQKNKLAAVGQLAAGIAHEIRNPLASISGSVQLLQASLSLQTAEDKKLLAIVVKEIDRLNRLIGEFLDFVRPEIRVEDPVNLNNLAKEILEIVKVNPNFNHKVEQHAELRSENIVYGHYDKLKQAILNFVINSYQAMSDTLRPEIFVRTYDSEDRVVFVVRDNGIGMSKENVQKMFEPFHTTKSNGTGLGLAITHKILEAHGASVHVESDIGRGTQISVSFPVGKSPESQKMYLRKQA